jgi:hypothetical protein
MNMALISIVEPEKAEGDITQLHDLGWEDRDILDALAHGCSMIGPSIMMKAFQMDVAC